jgi:predicted RNA binding protein YcfA (HicA-like mRNA interferase family)
MSHLIKLCSGLKTVKKFEKAGWKIDRQKGSHVMMVKKEYEYTLSIPLQKELGIGILKKLIKQAGLNIDQFNRL